MMIKDVRNLLIVQFKLVQHPEFGSESLSGHHSHCPPLRMANVQQIESQLYNVANLILFFFIIECQVSGWSLAAS